jgi:flotillin
VRKFIKTIESFPGKVKRGASQELAKMGLIIVAFTIEDVWDKSGYLESLGKPSITQVKREADLATVDAEKKSRIKRAEANMNMAPSKEE